MQTIGRAEEWKNAHRQTILSESFVEVSLDIADPDALADANPSDNGAIYISNSKNLTNGVDKKPTPYCTLEQNLWCLDGKRKALPESGFGENGYVSDVLSDETCVFNPKVPVITLDFEAVHDNAIAGITITWSDTYDEYADTFEVIVYNGDNVVLSREVSGNKSAKTAILAEIKGYNRIVIIIKKWCLPNHRARVEEIFVGVRKIYGKTDLFEYSHTQSVSPISTALPKVEIKFSIDNLNGEYNPYNPDGLSRYLMERQEVKARYGLKMDDGAIEWIDGGTFYLSEWYAKQNGLTADFTARDSLEFMSAIYYDSDFITKFDEIQENGRTLYSLAETILSAAELPLPNDGSPRWVIDDSLEEVITKAPLPEDTLANCLQLIANAGRCVIYPDRNGTLCVKKLAGEVTDYTIDSFNSYSKPEITLSKPIKQVIVKQYTYTKGDNGIESTTEDVITKVSASGETITVDNPLITECTDPAKIGQWMVENDLKSRMTIDSSWRADVRLDALDIVTNENAYNANQVRMTDIEFKYNGAFSGTGKGKVIGNG